MRDIGLEEEVLPDVPVDNLHAFFAAVLRVVVQLKLGITTRPP